MGDVRLQHLILLAALATPGAAPAWAQDISTPPDQSTGPTCINSGETYLQGEMACIAACHQQRRLARCDVVAGAGKWTYVSESCPTTMINPPWPSIWSELPAKVAMSPKPLVLDHSAPGADITLPVVRVQSFAMLGG